MGSITVRLFRSKPPYKLMSVKPRVLKFRIEVNKPIPCSFKLSSKSDKHVAFRVKTTNLIKYSVQPQSGILLPHSQINVTVTMSAQKEEPLCMPCDENCIVQCVAVPPGTTPEEITPEMYKSKVGNYVEECELSADYVDYESEEEPSEDDTAVSSEYSDHEMTDYDHEMTDYDHEMTDYQMTSTMELLNLGSTRENSGGRLIAVLGIVLGVLVGYYARDFS